MAYSHKQKVHVKMRTFLRKTVVSIWYFLISFSVSVTFEGPYFVFTRAEIFLIIILIKIGSKIAGDVKNLEKL